MRVASGTQFTNAGTINAFDSTPRDFIANNLAAIAVDGNGEIINSGTINLAGAIGVRGGMLINSGNILQSAGPDARGVFGVTNLNNSGIISTGQIAVTTGIFSSEIINSGTITSTNAAAIGASNSDRENTTRIINLAGGVITGGTGRPAIATSGNTYVENAGTINGNVNLATFTFGTVPSVTVYAPSTYVNAGGTLNGDLLFGTGNDVFVGNGNNTGVTGTVDGGAGTDTFIYGLTSTGSILIDDPAAFLAAAPVSSFENFGVGAIGADTTATVSGPEAGLNSGLLFLAMARSSTKPT
ncbi:MAG: hypothetical protein HC843_04695 [Sphingomonadales bacterium]|nr:hypothetical protein [Sphingomonadales bacterium]